MNLKTSLTQIITTFPLTIILVWAEDKNGYIWIGTNKGAIYLTNPKLATTENNQSMRCTRVKLINEEGIPYYFLDNTIITTIKVDNGNREMDWNGR